MSIPTRPQKMQCKDVMPRDFDQLIFNREAYVFDGNDRTQTVKGSVGSGNTLCSCQAGLHKTSTALTLSKTQIFFDTTTYPVV